MKIITLSKLISKGIKVSRQETYYPEKIRKSLLNRIVDNIIWIFKYREFNEFYNLYGMDIKGTKVLDSNYADHRNFNEKRRELRYDITSHSILVRDKLLFYRYMNEIGLPTPVVFAIIFDGNVLDLNFEPIDINIFMERKNYFIKRVYDGGGTGVIKIHDFEEYNKNKNKFTKGFFIIQESVEQHEKMKQLNPQSVNTIRLLTVIDKNRKVRLFSQFLRIGTKKSGNVDNWSYGSILIGINEDGYLQKFGFYKMGLGTKTNIHPDSKIKFDTFQIPYYTQAVEAAIKAHKFFYGSHSIGWDIAIVDDGYIFIEGNDNWDLQPIQFIHGGFKKEILDLMKKFRVFQKEITGF